MKSLGALLPTRPGQRDEHDLAEIESWLIERPYPLWPAQRLAVILAEARRREDPAASRLEHELELAEWRDRIQAERPPGCWCLGIGGCGRVGEPTPGGEALLSWRYWCDCPDGQRIKAEVLERRQEFSRQRQQAVVDRLFGSLPEGFRDWTLDSLGKQSAGHLRLAKRLYDWLDEDEGRKWLFLYGDVGRGKTGAAVAVTKALAQRGQAALFADTSYLLERLRQFNDPLALSEARDFVWHSLHSVDVLLLDDLGAERHRRDASGAVDWSTEQIWLLISERHRERRRTIITSNHTLDELADILGHPRVGSRIDERSLVFDLSKLPNLRKGGSSSAPRA